jgi:hypothetical protein
MIGGVVGGVLDAGGEGDVDDGPLLAGVVGGVGMVVGGRVVVAGGLVVGGRRVVVTGLG